MAEGMVRVVRRFWSWLAEAVRQDQTSVADGVMTKLAAPPRTRVQAGKETFDPDDEGKHGMLPPSFTQLAIVAIPARRDIPAIKRVPNFASAIASKSDGLS